MTTGCLEMDYRIAAAVSNKNRPEQDLNHELSTKIIYSILEPVQGKTPDVDQSDTDSEFTIMFAKCTPFPSSMETGMHDGGFQQQRKDFSEPEDSLEMKKVKMKENITSARKSLDAELKFGKRNSKPLLGEDKNTMLLNYLDEMKTRRQELQNVRARPEWLLMPVSRVQYTNFAADEESQTVGSILHEFFNYSKPSVKSAGMPQDTRYQHTTERANTIFDLQQLKNLSLANMELCSSERSLLLLPRLPNFKHNSSSIILGDPFTELKTWGCQGQAAKEVLQPSNFHVLEYKLRYYIWTLALPKTRIIELAKSETYSIHSCATVPALLHACRESRALAMEHYNLSFSASSTSPKVYFDFKYDWIYTRCNGCLGIGCTHKLTLTDDHEKLKSLIFEGPMTYNPFPKILRFYPAIERLILISGKSNAQRGEIDKNEVSFTTKVFEWDRTGDVMGLARKAWKELDPTGIKPLPLTQVWRASIPDVVDNIKRSSDPTKGLWTCCS